MSENKTKFFLFTSFSIFFTALISLWNARIIGADKTKILHVGGIFPIKGSGGWQGGQVYNLLYFSFNIQAQLQGSQLNIFCEPILQACQPAAMMALEDVNNNKDLLPGYKLHMHWNDSEV